MIYTSYFAKLKAIKEKFPEALIVSISHSKPEFLSNDNTVEDWGIFGPISSLLSDYKKGNCDEKEYAKRYLNYLDKIWPSTRNVFSHALMNTNTIIMLCYERPEKFCHRHLLADFLIRRGFECNELEI